MIKGRVEIVDFDIPDQQQRRLNAIVHYSGTDISSYGFYLINIAGWGDSDNILSIMNRLSGY